MIRPARIRTALRSIACCVALVGFLSTTGCVGRPVKLWAHSLPVVERDAAIRDFPADARRSLFPLSEIFYERIASRRFNSRATFEDPSMRQFFPTVAAYSDYYAALVDALENANIRFNRPTRIELVGIETDPSGSLRLSLHFVGKNDLPLRWWNATLDRTDEWRWQEGRWWVVPGKI